jgi:hypothetical protein
MVIRIRFAKPSKSRPAAGKPVMTYSQQNRRMALIAASLLTPAALMAGVLGLWRIAADLKWTSAFAIASGLFSHWQVWLGVAFLLQACARILNRYGRGGNAAVS